MKKLIKIFVKVAVLTAAILCFAQLLVGVTQAYRQSDAITELQTWRAIHQKDDDKQFMQIADLASKFEVKALENATDIANLKTEMSAIKAEVSGISNRLWLVLVAVFAQLLNVLCSFIFDNRSRKCEPVDASEE